MQNLSVEITHFTANQLKIKHKLIDFAIPKIMGIINLTDDSFFQSSRIRSDKQLITIASRMLEEGATFLDLGALSTRPQSTLIDIHQERKKIEHAISAILNEFPDALISIDTFRAEVADAGLGTGAAMINDISGFSFDPKLIDTVSKHRAAYVLMHLQGNFDTMHHPYAYTNIGQEVISYFKDKIDLLLEAGIYSIVLDPGFGFSKNLDQNYELLNAFERLAIFERPLLAGLSRKSMIYKKLGITPEESLNGTSILNTLAVKKGASILRVHDVAPAREIVELLF